jgi:hypothetical protein
VLGTTIFNKIQNTGVRPNCVCSMACSVEWFCFQSVVSSGTRISFSLRLTFGVQPHTHRKGSGLVVSVAVVFYRVGVLTRGQYVVHPSVPTFGVPPHATGHPLCPTLIRSFVSSTGLLAWIGCPSKVLNFAAHVNTEPVAGEVL